ncbi:uncharacterized protein LOC128880633 [Hylaeus volcanicus]|uniref:uncharacterized protein LOC128880633 n=1 Tax=Hylaeus volcanicus TaxID=313075 RepID=UPI0023B78E44|nr:uncharacterized protein LOC128880633 [Hylaeus volcanicus]
MAEEYNEICGFLDVKYLGGKYKVHKVRKRTLAPWKVWQRHWCSIRKLGPGLGVKVQLDYGISNGGNASPNDRDNSVIIPLDAIICRTQSRSKQFAFGIFPTKERKPLLYLAGNSETESQRWMANIRQLLRPRRHPIMPGFHNISIIDNAHSKASGYTGLYGDLIASTIGIFVKDVYTGEIVKNLDWQQVNHFHLITVGRPEDVKCICVIHTTKEFCGGVGELHVFCLEAAKLLQDLVTQGRGPKCKLNRRPLSLSEGDLRISVRDEIQRNYPLISERMDFKTINENKEMNVPCDEKNSKIHSKLTEPFYQPEPASVPNNSDNSGLLTFPHDRRISDISVASGIYEEIADEIDSNKATTSHFYMDQVFYNRPSEEPPPLPPRQRCASESMKGIRSVTSTRNSVLGEGNAFKLERLIDNCNYVPMSPRYKDITLHQLRTQASLQESDYVIMR